ncbi:polyprotein [Posavirus sp.]|nr:polyprotein [Posavirus sp.]
MKLFQMSDTNISANNSTFSATDAMSTVCSQAESTVQDLSNSLCNVSFTTHSSVPKRSVRSRSSLLSAGRSETCFQQFLVHTTPSSVPRSYSHLYSALCTNPLYLVTHTRLCDLFMAYDEYLQLISDVQRGSKSFPEPTIVYHSVKVARRPYQEKCSGKAELLESPITRLIETDWGYLGEFVPVISCNLASWEVEPPISRTALNHLDYKLFMFLSSLMVVNILHINPYDNRDLVAHLAAVLVRTNPIRAVTLEKYFEVILRNATILPVHKERHEIDLFEAILWTYETGDILYLSQMEFETLNHYLIHAENGNDTFITTIFEGLLSIMKTEAYEPDDAMEFESGNGDSTMIDLDSKSPEELQKLKEDLEKRLSSEEAKDKSDIEKQHWWNKLWGKVKSFFSKTPSEHVADAASDTILATIRATLSKIWTGCMNGLYSLYTFLCDNVELIAWVFIALAATYLISYMFYTSSDYDSTFCRTLFYPVQRILHFKTSAIRPESMDPVAALVTTLSTPFVVSASTTYHTSPVSVLRDVSTCITACEKMSSTFITSLQALPGALRRVFTKWFDPEHYLSKSESLALENTITTLAQYLSSASICQTTEFITFFNEVFDRLNPLVKRTTLSRGIAPLWSKIVAFHSASVIKMKAGTFRFEPYYIHFVGDPGAGKSLLAPKVALEAASAIIENPTVCATDLDLTNYGGQDVIFVDELGTVNPTPDQMNNFLEMVSCLPFFPDLPSLEAHGSGGQKGTPMNALIVATSGNYTKINMNSTMIEHAYYRRMSMIVKFIAKDGVKLNPRVWTLTDDIAAIVDRDLEIYCGQPDYNGKTQLNRVNSWDELIAIIKADLTEKYKVHSTMKHALGYSDSREIALSNIDAIRKDIQDSLDLLSAHMSDDISDDEDIPSLPDPSTFRPDGSSFWTEFLLSNKDNLAVVTYLTYFGSDEATSCANLLSLIKSVQWTHDIHPEDLLAVEWAFELIAHNAEFLGTTWEPITQYLKLTPEGFSNKIMRSILICDPDSAPERLRELVSSKYTTTKRLWDILPHTAFPWATQTTGVKPCEVKFQTFGEIIAPLLNRVDYRELLKYFSPALLEPALDAAMIVVDNENAKWYTYDAWYRNRHLETPKQIKDKVIELDQETSRHLLEQMANARKTAQTSDGVPIPPAAPAPPPPAPSDGPAPECHPTLEQAAQQSEDDVSDDFFEETPSSFEPTGISWKPDFLNQVVEMVKEEYTKPKPVETREETIPKDQEQPLEAQSTSSPSEPPAETAHVTLDQPVDKIYGTHEVQPNISRVLYNMATMSPASVSSGDLYGSDSDSDFSTASSTDSVHMSYKDALVGRSKEETLSQVNAAAISLYNEFGDPSIRVKTIKELPKDTKPLTMWAPVEVMEGQDVDPRNLDVYLPNVELPDGFWALQKVQAIHSVCSADAYSTKTTCYCGYKFYLAQTENVKPGSFYNSAQVFGFTKTMLSMRNYSYSTHKKPILMCMAKFLHAHDHVNDSELNQLLSVASTQDMERCNELLTMMREVQPESSDVVYWQEQITAFNRGVKEACVKTYDLARPVHLSLRTIDKGVNLIAKTQLGPGKFISLGVAATATRDLPTIVERLYTAMRSLVAPDTYSRYITGDKQMVIVNEDYMAYNAQPALKSAKLCVGEDTTAWGPMMKFKAGLLVNETTQEALGKNKTIYDINRTDVRKLVDSHPALVVQMMLEALPHYDFEYDPLPVMGDAVRNIVDSFFESRYDHFLKSIVYKFGLSTTENILKTANSNKWKESDVSTLLPSYETISTHALDFGGALDSVFGVNYPEGVQTGDHSQLYKKVRSCKFTKDSDMETFYQYAASPKNKETYIVNWVMHIPYCIGSDDEIHYTSAVVSSFGFYFLKMFPVVEYQGNKYYFQSSFLGPDHQSAKWKDLSNCQKILNEAGCLFANSGLASRPSVAAVNLVSKLLHVSVGTWNVEMYLRCLSKTQKFSDFVTEPICCATMLRHSYYAPEDKSHPLPLRPSQVSTLLGANVPYDPTLTKKLTDALQVCRITGKKKDLIAGATLDDMVTTNSFMNFARSGLKLANSCELRDGFLHDKKKTYASIVKSVSTVVPDVKADLAYQGYMTRPKKTLEKIRDKGSSKYPDALARAIAAKELHSSLYDKFVSGFKIFSIVAIVCSLVWSISFWLHKKPLRAESPEVNRDGFELAYAQDNALIYPSLKIMEPSRMFVRFYSGPTAFYAIQYAADLFVMNYHVYNDMKALFHSGSHWYMSHSFYGRTPNPQTIELDRPGFFPVAEDPDNDRIVVRIHVPQSMFVKQSSACFVSEKDLAKASETQSHYEVIVAPDARLSRGTFQPSGNIVHPSRSNHIVYYSETRRGDCGLPVIISKGLLAGQIVGLHYASSDAKVQSTQRVCYGTVVSQEFLKRAYDTYMNSSLRFESQSLKELAASDDTIGFVRDFAEHNVHDLSVLPLKSRIHIPDQTEYVDSTCKTLAEQIIGPCKEQPAILSKNDPRSGGVDPVKMNILSLNENPALECSYDSNLLATVADEVVQSLTQFRPLAAETRILTTEEAVFGIPGVLGPMDLDASPGYDLMKLHPGSHKKSFVDTTNHTVDGAICMQVEQRLSMMNQGYPAYQPGENILVMYLKDELMRNSKVEEKRTRAIYCNDFVGGILFRRLCGGFLAYYYRNRVRNNSAVATNMLSADATVILDHLTQGFDQVKFVMGDYKGFDQHYHPAFQKQAYKVFCKCVRLLTKDVPGTLYTSLVNHDVYPTIFAGPFCFQTACSHFSGCCFTTIINNIMNEMYMRYAFHKIYPAHIFSHHVHAIFYGDDHLLAMPRDFDFSFSMIKNELQKLGQVYTPATKDSQSCEYYYNISDLVFCSTTFRPQHGVYMGVLQDKVSQRLFYYSRKSETTQDKINRFEAYKCIVAGGNRQDYLTFLDYCGKLLKDDLSYPPSCFADTQNADRERAFYAGTFDLSHPSFVSIDTIRPESQLPTAPLYYPAADQPPTVTMATHIIESHNADPTQTSSTIVPYSANAGPQDIPLTAANNVKRDSFVVESAMDSGYILKSYPIPNGLLNIGTDKSTQTLGLRSFQLVRFNLDVLFMLVSNVTVCAKLAAVFVPFRPSTDFKVGEEFPLTSYRWLPYIDMYPDNNTLYDFNVPFCCPQTLQHSSELTSKDKYWGSLVVFVVSHISKPTQIGDIPIAANATIDVTVFTGLKGIFNTLPKPVYRAEALEAVSSVLRATETAGEVTAEASRSVRETLAKYLWGCDEFTVNNKSIAVYQKFPGMPSSSGITPTTTLDVLPTSRSIQHVLLTDPESMWINKILQIPFYVRKFSWNVSQSRDSILLQIPMSSIFLTSGNAVPLNVVLLNMCYLYHVDFCFDIEVIKTSYHSGALRMTVSYDGRPDQSQLSCYTGSAFVVDKESVFSYKAPYNSTLEYLRTIDTFPPDPRWEDPRYTMGWFTLSVETPLKITALVSTEVECILHVYFDHFYGVYPRSFEPFSSESSHLRFESQDPNETETGPKQEPTSLDGGHNETIENKIELPNPEYKEPARMQATQHANTFKPHNYYTENSGKKFEYSLSSLLAFEKRFKRLPSSAIQPLRDSSLPEGQVLHRIDFLSCLTFRDLFASYAGSFELRVLYSGDIVPQIYCLPMPPVEDVNSNYYPSFGLLPDLSVQLASGIRLSTSGSPLPALDLPAPVGSGMWYVDVTVPFVVQENVAMLHSNTTYSTSASYQVLLLSSTESSLLVYARVGDDFAYHYHTLPPLYSVTTPPKKENFVMGQYIFHGN